ncbi:gelsolin, cytoplasmic-like isoform X3 [Centruroides vittatus]|uniref:gelsolin, cytoplasmic-like isoform X3 n=1 Tax=Centruroides vittatus TaxID=120091 RepID=UPI0035108DF3
MTVLDPAFEGAGQEAGLQIWRIEQMQVKPIDPKQYGSFYSGDSYILLHTRKTKSGHFDWNIHFWLGTNTSQDEAGAAAIKSVELDDVLGGSPVQHREVQQHESKLFLSYFKSGVRYLEGGVASGFRHVTDEVEKRLFQVKGRRNVRVHQVELSIDSMNKGDCFILDVGRDIYLWTGEKSGRMERIKAIQAATGIRDDVHAGKSIIHILDESCSADEKEKFFEELGGGSDADVKDAESGGDDAEHERTLETEVSLYRISDEPKLTVDRIEEKPLKQEFLESDNCFLLDGGMSGIFVWVGKSASHKERVESMKLAEKYLDYRGYPKWVSVTRVIAGAEPPTFKQYFVSWKEPEEQIGLGRVYTPEQIAASELTEPDFNVLSLHREKRLLLAKNSGKAYGFMPDDGSGNIEIWRIENFELAPVDESAKGMFFGGDSYVLKYTYNIDGRERYIVYFWQGKNSSLDEKASSAIWAVKLDNDLFGKAIQVRVVQGAEPQHFIRIFKGKMIIFMGGHASGFRNVRDHDTYDPEGSRMFRIKGTTDYDVRAEQVPEAANSLNSGDVFVVETPSTTYIWIGKESSEDERNMGRNIISLISPDREAVEIMEEEEPDEFWEGIGGKTEYEKFTGLPEKPLLEPRLFQCSTDTGKLRVEEICSFTQEDLAEDDVMVLDSGDEIFVWIGKGASEDEKSQSLKMAEDYIRTDPTERTLDNTVIITIKQGEEPATFIAIFDEWNSNMWDNMRNQGALI